MIRIRMLLARSCILGNICCVFNRNKIQIGEMFTMKCVKCGEQLSESDQFCHKCGAKVLASDPKIKFCRECGTQLDEKSIYCPNCGTKVLPTEYIFPEQFDQEERGKDEDADSTLNTHTPPNNTCNLRSDSISMAKMKVANFWNGLDLFSKCSVVSLVVGLLLVLISICTSRGGAGLFSVLQISCTLAAMLMHKNIIIVKKNWLRYIFLFASIPLIFLNINCYTVKKAQPTESFQHVAQETTIETELVSHSVVVPGNSSKFHREPLENVESAFRSAGFSDVHTKEKSISGSNYLEAIDTVDSVTIDGIGSFEDGQSFPDDAPVIIYYRKAQEGKNVINLYIDFQENLLFSTYDISLSIDDYSLGTLPHGTSKKFELNLDTGSHILKAQKIDNPAISGTIGLNISETSDITIRTSCHSNLITMEQTYYESKRELQENEARVPQSAESYKGRIYSEVISELKGAGFIDISTSVVRDITGEWLDAKEGEIKSITIRGKNNFIKSEVFLKDDPVVIQYHTQAYTRQEMQEKIWMSVDKPADDILSYFKETPCSVTCFVLGRKIDSFSPTGYFLESGTVSDDSKTVVLNFTNPELKAMKETLVNCFPQDMAIRVVVTAMTNGQATDVFKADGMTYNTQKFHKYSDISGFYLYPYETGTWIAISENTWRVEDMKCMLSGFTTAIKVSTNITFDGSKYTLSNVDKVIAGKTYIDSGDTEDFVPEHYDGADSAPFLTVQPYLVSEGRNISAEQERNNRTMPTATRKKWIDNQIDWFTGRDEQFEKIIKRNLNDEKSFKESETTYIDIVNEDILREVNTALQNGGYSNRCKIGDLLIMCKFTAKNAFNATIKYTAIGISSYDSNTIALVGVG